MEKLWDIPKAFIAGCRNLPTVARESSRVFSSLSTGTVRSLSAQPSPPPNLDLNLHHIAIMAEDTYGKLFKLLNPLMVSHKPLPHGYEKLVSRSFQAPGYINGSMEYSVYENVSEGIAVLAFRGTDTPGDWNSDLMHSDMIEAKEHLGEDFAGKIHHGFCNQYQGMDGEGRDTIWKDIKEKVIDAATISRLVITGHSLGGGMATIAAVDAVKLLQDTGIEISVVTFGSPRVGDWSFVRCYNDLRGGEVAARTVRVVSVDSMENTQDLITTIPNAHHKETYQHVVDPKVVTYPVSSLLPGLVVSLKLHVPKTYVLASVQLQALATGPPDGEMTPVAPSARL